MPSDSCRVSRQSACVLANRQHSVCNSLHHAADADDLQVILSISVAVCRRAVFLADRNNCGGIATADRANSDVLQKRSGSFSLLAGISAGLSAAGAAP